MSNIMDFHLEYKKITFEQMGNIISKFSETYKAVTKAYLELEEPEARVLALFHDLSTLEVKKITEGSLKASLETHGEIAIIFIELLSVSLGAWKNSIELSTALQTQNKPYQVTATQIVSNQSVVKNFIDLHNSIILSENTVLEVKLTDKEGNTIEAKITKNPK